jgi:hypothetical protein
MEETMGWRFLLLSAFLAVSAQAYGQSGAGYVPKGGFVPDAKTAIAIAEAVLKPIYGEEQIKSERPFSAHLSQGVWRVEGHLPDEDVGGVAEVRIRKSDAAVLFVLHGK